MLAALVSQLCEKELREERCLLERLFEWLGRHPRGNVQGELPVRNVELRCR